MLPQITVAAAQQFIDIMNTVQVEEFERLSQQVGTQPDLQGSFKFSKPASLQKVDSAASQALPTPTVMSTVSSLGVSSPYQQRFIPSPGSTVVQPAPHRAQRPSVAEARYASCVLPASHLRCIVYIAHWL